MQQRSNRIDIDLRVRRLAAEHLGVAEADLLPDFSLVDELAVDSLDLAELAAALEDELAVMLPDTVLQEVRTYGDLLEAVATADAERRRAESDPGVPPIRVVARLSRAGAGAPPFERSGEFTPYLAQVLEDDAARLGAGGRLELSVVSPLDTRALARVRSRLAPLASQGLDVRVQLGSLPQRRRHTSAA